MENRETKEILKGGNINCNLKSRRKLKDPFK
jgi:hypothetical protein